MLQNKLTEAAVRLVGPNSCEGRVEVFSGNAWGSVCSALWDLHDAQVLCSELSCGTAVEASSNGKYGRGPPYSGLTYFQCTGAEKDLLSCPYTNLSHIHLFTSDAGAKCTGPKRMWHLTVSITSKITGINNTVIERAMLTAFSSLAGQNVLEVNIRKRVKL
ncbi:scavenger receptor cysteine-rich domain-containing group B protein-like [Hyperolius riggenbachi]|uniref:scavenger receptor cysteine-rich domain-containing group B protein-like n=1 Tax=Hyperolius riggenbachi TaxID=752182 RepID=UPI0035A2D623